MSSVANQERIGVRSPSGTAHEWAGHSVSVRLVRAVADILQSRGLTAEALLGEENGLLYAEPLEGRIPLSRYQALFARAIDLTSDPALGLHVGLHAAESSFGLVSPLISHASSLREALDLVIRFHPLLLEGTRIQLTERLGTAIVQCEYPQVSAHVDRSLAELIVAGLERTLRAFGCAVGDIRAVRFEHARPEHHAAYTAAFRGVERFEQAFTGVEFAAQALDRPHIHGNPQLASLLCAEAERTLKQVGQPTTCAEQVLAIMRRHRQRGRTPHMQNVAREVGCSVRSLRRRLQEEATSFSALDQVVLEASARSLLHEPTLTFQGIAHTLGFASATAFHRAFKRWTKLTPHEYRKLRDSL